MTLQLYENRGWGSAIVEAQLAYYGLEHRPVQAGDVHEDRAARDALKKINPLAQIPTLVLDGGEVVTESAAMTLLLADLAGSTALVPGPGEVDRPGFLRWLIYLVAAVYPRFFYGEVPSRLVSAGEEVAFKAAVDATRLETYRVMEAEAVRRGGPWYLGARMTAVDVCLMVMVQWRPGLAWFQAEAPRPAAIAVAAAARPAFAGVMRRNFG